MKPSKQKNFINFNYGPTTSFNLFIKYDMTYENMRQFTTDIKWVKSNPKNAHLI